MTFVESLQAIPASIWVVVGGLVSLAGVVLTNWVTYLTLKARLKHEAEESALKRKSEIRKEVYLKAAEQLVVTNATINSVIGRGNFEELTLAGKELSIACTKLQALLTQEDALCVSQLSAAYAILLVRLSPLVSPIKSLHGVIEVKTRWIEQTDAEISRILKQRTAHIESGNRDRQAFDRLQTSLEMHQALVKGWAEEREKIYRQLIPMQIRASVFVIGHAEQVLPKTVKLLMAIRRDFEVGGEEEAFLQEAQRSLGETKAIVEQALNELNQEVAR